MKKIIIKYLIIISVLFVIISCKPPNYATILFKVSRSDNVTGDLKTYAFYYSESQDKSSFTVFSFVSATINIGKNSSSGKGYISEGEYYLKFEQPYDTGYECGITENKVKFVEGEIYRYEILDNNSIIDDLNIHGTFTVPCNY
jgi:hypothetical protein